MGARRLQPSGTFVGPGTYALDGTSGAFVVLPANGQTFYSDGSGGQVTVTGYDAATKRITDEGRTYFQSQFAVMGLEFIPSYANFVLVKVGDGNAVFKAMMDQGVIVRAMAAYKLPEWVRISIGTMPQNVRCIEVLKGVLGK